jgi:methionine-rich copper-binding protein CopC
MKITLVSKTQPLARRALIFTLALSLWAAPNALAHARMLRSNPAKDAKLTAAPGSVDLWFNELLDEGFNSLEVYAAAELGAEHHKNLAPEKPAVDPADRTHLSVKLPPLPPGEYVVEWRVLSRDGHSAPGRYTFRIRPGK